MICLGSGKEMIVTWGAPPDLLQTRKTKGRTAMPNLLEVQMIHLDLELEKKARDPIVYLLRELK